jgi:large subunit ribosomal protein L9
LERQYKITIDKRKMALDDPIRVLGTTSIPIKLYLGVVATLQVQVTEA